MNKFLINKILIKTSGTSVFLLGVTVIIGWYFNLPILIQVHPSFVAMQFNTALGFFVLGLAILIFNIHRKIITISLATIAILLGSLTLIQYIFQIDLSIDTLFMEPYILVGASHPGRMAPNTALNFLLSGIALVLISQPKRKINLLTSSFLGALVIGLGTVVFLGYLSSIETAYGWGRLTRMALHTSSGFVVFGFALILQSHYLSLLFHKRVSSLFFPVTTFVLGITMTIALWQALSSTTLFNPTLTNRLSITHPLATSILLFGGTLSIVLAIAILFALRFYEQVKALKLAQEKILTLNQKLETLSYIDALTEIANRRFFDITFEKEWNRALRYNYPVALMLIDIDYFKKYNDFYGHQKGDECIRKVALIIDSMARRKTDIAARYGGEEFVLLLANIEFISAQKIAENLIQEIRDANIEHSDSPISSYLTISVGLFVEVPTSELNIEKFIFHADTALYQAKKLGRNQIAVAKF